MAYSGRGEFRKHTHCVEDTYEAALSAALQLGRGWHHGEPNPIEVWVEEE